jgi:prepilin-type N-terminal cleavage/methylation domain-containing protein
MSRPIEPARGHRPAAGFTLLEVLVALVCFALVFGVLAQIMRTGLRQSASAESATTASLLARSQLARVGFELPLEPGEVAGEVDGMRWRTTVRLADMGPPSAESVGEDTDISVYRIDVTVAWGEPEDGLDVTLTTLKLGPTPR